jgi:G3E family GTPase
MVPVVALKFHFRILGHRDHTQVLAMDSAFFDTEGDHKHDMTVSSVGIVIEGQFIPDKLNEWLSRLLRTKGADIFRSKGILAVLGTDDRFVFQVSCVQPHLYWL